MATRLEIETGRALAPLTTLGLGGPAAHFAAVESREQLCSALAWAAARRHPVRVLGGGSNLVVADEGVPGLVVQVGVRGIARDGERLHVQAGERWDDVVELAVQQELAGIECLSGIPGSVGAAPIQNVGAYGQEVAEVIEAVEVLERASQRTQWFDASECGFGYRDSRFKREPDRYVVLSVRFKLRAGGAPTLRYAELARTCRPDATLREVRQSVRALRARKGMVLEEGFVPSAGSFFMNPVLAADEAERVVERALALGIVSAREQVPRFAAGDDVKLAAAWLIERAGIAKGMRQGDVGVSARHSLALVNHGGTTRELLALADRIARRVEAVFGISLQREPICWP